MLQILILPLLVLIVLLLVMFLITSQCLSSSTGQRLRSSTRGKRKRWRSWTLASRSCSQTSWQPIRSDHWGSTSISLLDTERRHLVARPGTTQSYRHESVPLIVPQTNRAMVQPWNLNPVRDVHTRQNFCGWVTLERAGLTHSWRNSEYPMYSSIPSLLLEKPLNVLVVFLFRRQQSWENSYRAKRRNMK